MLVDNSVSFDSRVQKQAKSAAEAGWEVFLLGKALKRGDVAEWDIGDAHVRLVWVPTPMHQRRHEFRRALLRSPLAYRPGRMAAYRKQQVKAWKGDIRFRQAALATRTGLSAHLLRLWLAMLLFVAKVVGRWVAMRSRYADKLRNHRKAMDGPTDKLSTKFWRLLMGPHAWRRLDPSMWDLEVAYGPVIDELKPDLIHANDFRMLAVGARAATRSKATGRDAKLVWDAHEYLPGIKPWVSHPRWHPAQILLEREFAPYADSVITVTHELADLLVEEHGLKTIPDVVFNAPIVSDDPGSSHVIDIRTACGITTDAPLFVYSGAAAPQRGLDLMIDSLPMLEGVHVALVVLNAQAPYIVGLADRATELGVRDRLHLVPYVGVDDIVPFLVTADVGVIPVHHWPNHEISLGTKFFEYSHARLPILVSDVKAMADMVIKTGQGEVFVAEDLDDYVRASKELIADKARYVKAYETPGLLDAWTWDVQAAELERIYARLLDT